MDQVTAKGRTWQTIYEGTEEGSWPRPRPGRGRRPGGLRLVRDEHEAGEHEPGRRGAGEHYSDIRGASEHRSINHQKGAE